MSSTYARVAGVLFATAVTGALLVMLAPASAHAHRLAWREQRQHTTERARSQLGVPFRYGGESPRGFDCSGFTRWTFEDHGARLPRTAADQFHLARRDDHKRIWKRNDLEVGDLVFHKTTSARVGHTGIYIGNGRFISATSSKGVRVRSLYDPYYWGRRWVGGTRLPATART